MQYPNTIYTSAYRGDYANRHNELADLAAEQKWSEVIQKLTEHKDMINCCRLPTENGPPATLYTVLHQAASKSAPVEVFQELLDLGASKTLKTADGETAYDIGKRVGLSPNILHLIDVPAEVKQNADSIQKLEEGLHKTILGRARDLIQKNGQQLPQLAFLYEFGSFWYPIPGMYGGFNIEKHAEGVQTESWSRVVGGSGQRHLIDNKGEAKMTDEGFV